MKIFLDFTYIKQNTNYPIKAQLQNYHIFGEYTDKKIISDVFHLSNQHSLSLSDINDQTVQTSIIGIV